MILNPAFPQEDFEQIKINKHWTNLSTLSTDADAMSGIVSGIVNYGTEHPYGEVSTDRN
jgi:zinc protease